VPTANPLTGTGDPRRSQRDRVPPVDSYLRRGGLDRERLTIAVATKDSQAAPHPHERSCALNLSRTIDLVNGTQPSERARCVLLRSSACSERKRPPVTVTFAASGIPPRSRKPVTGISRSEGSNPSLSVLQLIPGSIETGRASWLLE
jgi:hypothetical protein